MKKIFFSTIVCLLLILGSIVALACAYDRLAIILLFLTIIPGCFFNQGVKEVEHDRHARQ